MFKQYKLRNYNFRLIFFCLVISFIGIMVIGSAKESSQSRQILGLVLGLIAMVIASLFDYHILLKMHWIIYLGSIGLLVLVLLQGVVRNGSKRWFIIPGLGIQFQPSELVKILLILILAWFFSVHEEEMKKSKIVLMALALIAPILFLILREPDLSTTICYFMVFVIMIFVAGISYKWVLGVIGISIPSVIIFFSVILNSDSELMEGYQVKRILAWLYPDRYPELAYQQQNSIMAIGSGQLTGKGLANNVIASVKNGNFIAEPQTDFIFAVAGEELGFIGSCSIIILAFLIVIELLNIARKSSDYSGMLICTGLAALIGFQSFMNISVATGIIPNTGIPLPFVSYGQTSLISLYMGIGIALNVGLQGHHSQWRD